MTTAVDVCNLALTHIGKPAISDLNEATAEAKACRLMWGHARRTMLQASLWTFALRRVDLAVLTNDMEGRWAYRYAYPNTALKVTRLAGAFFRRHDYPSPAFEVREGSIYTNAAQAKAEIIVDVTDPAFFPPLFVHALSFHLAMLIARPLTRSKALTAEMRDERDVALSAAITADATQDMPRYGLHPDEDYSRAQHRW